MNLSKAVPDTDNLGGRDRDRHSLGLADTSLNRAFLKVSPALDTEPILALRQSSMTVIYALSHSKQKYSVTF